MKKTSNESGFTLVELMVVVAIIGILSAVAIPNFKRYQAKTKTSEAKLQLSAVYSALTSMQSDYDAFATCLSEAGYLAPSANNYYAIGFDGENTVANAIVRNNGGSCADGPTPANHRFTARKSVGGYTALPAHLTSVPITTTASGGLDNSGGDITTPGVDDTGSYFVAGAIGGIDADNNTATLASKWGINENKDLREINRGY